MNVVAFNGSARKDGNTAILVRRVMDALAAEGIDSDLLQLAGKRVHGCTACMKCVETADGSCPGIKDYISDECIPRAIAADGIIIASPVYFGDVTAETKALIDRIGYAARKGENRLAGKVGTAIAVNRRAGALHALDSINHLFMIAEMVVVGSSYWNMAVAHEIGDAEKDEEGLRTMDVLGRNMARVLLKLNA